VDRFRAIACQKERGAGHAKGVQIGVRVLMQSFLSQDNVLCRFSHAVTSNRWSPLAKSNE
jgi:hypothetical protein